jgi:hypothetical protein
MGFFQAQPGYQSLLDTFTDDTVHLSAQYLLQLVTGSGRECAALFVVKHYATRATHYLAILDTGHPMCDCMMGVNLGIPCRHFYTVLRLSQSPTQFHLGLINQRYASSDFYSTVLNRFDRWLSNPNLDITATRAVGIGYTTTADDSTEALTPIHLPSFHRCPSPLPETRTLPPKLIHHQAITKFQDILQHVHTAANLQSLNEDIDAIM